MGTLNSPRPEKVIIGVPARAAAAVGASATMRATQAVEMEAPVILGTVTKISLKVRVERETTMTMMNFNKIIKLMKHFIIFFSLLILNFLQK